MVSKINIRKDIFYMSQLEKLKALQSQNSAGNASLTLFNNVIVVNVGVNPTQHFPKIKDKFGNKIKDEKGKDKRSEISDGYTYTFVEFGTGKMVKIILQEERQFGLLQAYKVAGLGYDMRAANMIFIEQKGQIVDY